MFVFPLRFPCFFFFFFFFSVFRWLLESASAFVPVKRCRRSKSCLKSDFDSNGRPWALAFWKKACGTELTELLFLMVLLFFFVCERCLIMFFFAKSVFLFLVCNMLNESCFVFLFSLLHFLVGFSLRFQMPCIALGFVFE